MIKQKVFRKKDLFDLKNLVNKYDSNKIFLVRGNKSYSSSGANLFIDELVKKEKLNSFYDFDPNPHLKDLEKGISRFNEGKFEIIIAIGGGSVLDMAKLISVFAHLKDSIEDVVHGKLKIDNKKTPLIAIPTTAGSGAEATQFSVLYIDKKKYSIGDPVILPDYVFLSSEFSVKANNYLAACSGLDAFCQAAESIWNVNATEESLEYGLKASKLIWKNLYKAVRENDVDARESLQEASFLAGKAINITKTTAPHALSYAFTSYYGIPHGHAVALSFPFFLEYNYNVTESDCTDKKGAKIVKERIDQFLTALNLSPVHMKNEIINFFNSIEISTDINLLIKNFDPEIVINNVNFERLNNNPRKVTKETIRSFLID
jgi:alcohol dehydrogenase class IV